jgi:hypothetical protein
MTFYTSNVKTWTIDPVFNLSKVRSEFRLDSDKLYTSALRLLNVGLVVDEKSSRYNLLVGGQPIRRIVLYDGKQVLDSVDFHNLEGFRRYNKTNATNCDAEKVLKKHGLGFTFWRNNSLNVVADDMFIQEFNEVCDNEPTTTEGDTPKTFINLRDVLPMLRAVPYVHTGVFKDVRIVIDYIIADSLSLTGTSVAIGTTIPLLVADEILDPKVASDFVANLKQVSWNAIENETISVPAVQAPVLTPSQSIKFKLTGFSNKTLGRILIQKQPFTANQLYGTACSMAMIGESFRFLVNGSDLLSDKLDRPNMTLGMLNDTWGTCNTHTSAADLSIYDSSNLIANSGARVGSLAYVAVTVSQKINDFQIEYSRETPITASGGSDARYVQGLYINVFGEVAKQLVITKTGYVIRYL